MSGGYYGGFPSLEAVAEQFRVFDPQRPISPEEQLQRISWLHLIVRAQEARENASSYRNFHVGCAVWAFKTDAIEVEGRWAVFTGSNIKVADGARPVCAEQLALGAAKSAGYDRIIAMVIVGEPQEDAESGLQSNTLHPCGECRKIFQAASEVSSETLLLMFTPDEQTEEHFSVGELLVLHQNAQQRHHP